MADTSGYQAVVNPPVPFKANLPKGFGLNRSVTVCGNGPAGADRFHIDLYDSKKKQVVLHVNPRFQWGIFVRNTNAGSWGTEESDKMPFGTGEQFEITIKNEGSVYGIYVNGEKLYTYKHRLPAENIDCIQIAGDVDLCSVQF